MPKKIRRLFVSRYFETLGKDFESDYLSRGSIIIYLVKYFDFYEGETKPHPKKSEPVKMIRSTKKQINKKKKR